MEEKNGNYYIWEILGKQFSLRAQHLSVTQFCLRCCLLFLWRIRNVKGIIVPGEIISFSALVGKNPYQ